MYICCDLGGTNARFGVYEPPLGQILPISKKSYPNKNFADFYECFENYLAFLNEQPQKFSIKHTSLAIAGRVDKERKTGVLTAGAVWRSIELNEMTEILSAYEHSQSTSMINDFEALGYGVLLWKELGLKEEDFQNIFGNFRVLKRKKKIIFLSFVYLEQV